MLFFNKRYTIPKWQSKRTIQRNWQHDEEKQNNNTTQYVLDTQTNTNNVNKTGVLLQTTGGKDEPNKHN
jgi:hypothetical protein